LSRFALLAADIPAASPPATTNVLIQEGRPDRK
jgi:hypothetical protein